MSRVRFDLESDSRFLDSLRDLGNDTADRILAVLESMSDRVSWTEMVQDYYWEELPIPAVDSYPGAHAYYRFVIALSDTELYEIVALNYAPPTAVCVLARLALVNG